MAGSDLPARARKAIARGHSALAACRSGGRWSGFPTLAGWSEVWVTAFIAAHLAKSGAPKQLVRSAREWLVGQRLPGCGWGYGGDVPADADSTAWCLNALAGTELLSREARRQAESFLALHQSEGGTSTYVDDGRIRAYIRAGPGVAMNGWSAPHDDVTAAALLAGVPSRRSEAAREVLALLLKRQSGAGLWNSYWWRGPWYTTALVLRAFAHAGVRLPDECARKILRALDREVLAGGGYALGAAAEADAFTTALALECACRLSLPGAARAFERTGEALLSLQAPDGGWPGAFVLRIPAPDIVEPRVVADWAQGSGGGNSFVFDEGGLFATTLACFSLNVLLRAGSRPPTGPVLGPPAHRPAEPEVDVVTVARS